MPVKKNDILCCQHIHRSGFIPRPPVRATRRDLQRGLEAQQLLHFQVQRYQYRPSCTTPPFSIAQLGQIVQVTIATASERANFPDNSPRASSRSMLKGWSQRLCVSDGTLLNPRDSKPRALTMEKLDGLHVRRSPHTPEPIPSDFVVSSPFLGLWVWIRRRGQCQRSNLPNPTTLSSSYSRLL